MIDRFLNKNYIFFRLKYREKKLYFRLIKIWQEKYLKSISFDLILREIRLK